MNKGKVFLLKIIVWRGLLIVNMNLISYEMVNKLYYFFDENYM